MVDTLQVGTKQLIETGTSIYKDFGSAAFTIFIVIAIVIIFLKYVKKIHDDFERKSEKERNMWIEKVETKEKRIDELHVCHALDLKNIIATNNDIIKQVNETIFRFNQTLLDLRSLIHSRVGI